MQRIIASLVIASLFCVPARAQSSQPRTIVVDEKRLFHAEAREPKAVWTEATLDGSRRAIALRSGGIVLRGWHLPSVDPAAPYVLTFRGNDETIADAYSQARDEFFNTALNLNVVTFDYRGTGFSDGTISLRGARADALAIYDFVAKRAAGRPVFVCGWSLGSIFASHVAGSRTSLAGLMLLDPLSAVAGPSTDATYAAGLRRGLRKVYSASVRDGIRNAEELRRYDKPLLVVHGTEDHVLALAEGRADYEAAASTDKVFVSVAGKGHSGTIWSIEASDALAAFVLRHSRPAKSPN